MIQTIETTAQQAPELLRNDIDQRLTKLRPMSTPVDQISRFTLARPVNSMKVGYYALAMRDFEAKVTANFLQTNLTENNQEISIKVNKPSAFDVSETVMISGAIDSNGEPIVFYVMSIDRAKMTLNLRPINPVIDSDNGASSVPRIEKGSTVMRMGRAAGELDVQTGQYESLPEKKENYCQIFKTQIEQSTLLTRSNKEVGWTMSDQEEVAIYDMRLGMERSFLFGHKAVINDPVKKCDVYLTGGIWNQAGKEANYSDETISAKEWTEIMAMAFTGHNSGKRKVLIGGTKLIERLSLLTTESTQRLMMSEQKVTRWGLDFSEMISKFGTLYVIHSEVLDSCGHTDDGIIIDPEYLTKYVHTPFKAETLDLRTSGQRNTEAVVMTEISCLVLRHPMAHCRIIKTDKQD